jgi:lipopolysaccharide transport system permease protein
MLKKADPSWSLLCTSVLVVVVLLTGGLYYFRRVETTFADVV